MVEAQLAMSKALTSKRTSFAVVALSWNEMRAARSCMRLGVFYGSPARATARHNNPREWCVWSKQLSGISTELQ